MTADKVASNLGPVGIRALAVGAQAIGALALGALAIGTLALGAVAIGRLAIGRSRIKRLEIDELVVKKVRITDSLERPIPSYPAIRSLRYKPITRRRFRALVFASQSLPPDPEFCPQAQSCTEWLG